MKKKQRMKKKKLVLRYHTTTHAMRIINIYEPHTTVCAYHIFFFQLEQSYQRDREHFKEKHSYCFMVRLHFFYSLPCICDTVLRFFFSLFLFSFFLSLYMCMCRHFCLKSYLICELNTDHHIT